MIDRVKEVDSLDGLLLDGARLGEPVEGTDTGREVVERCEVRQIAAVAAVHVVHLDRGTGEAVFDAGPLDASGKLRTDLPGQLRADLTAEKVGDLLRLDAQHRLAGEMFVERPERPD